MTDQAPERRRKAVAVRYDAAGDAAPRIVAKGSGLLAERILELAQQHGVYIHEDPDLVAVLSKLDVTAEIPEILYRAIAEILVFVYGLNKRMKPGSERGRD
ncbi:MAG: EscU/YscU/HrcU family type III secretion system export apparatus switch protein [Candidatus Hydrogenedentes bacterium]|nr:EscU/YscU/HrcU family type III secretion system export apparatus switch protein [Candidatus Hydrogenedentota bacterium]